MQNRLEALEGKVQVSERELVRYAQNHNIMSLAPGQVDLIERRLETLDKQAAEAEAEVATATARRENAEHSAAVESASALSPGVVTELTNKVLQLEQDLSNLRASYGENWPGVIQKKQELELVQGQLAREKTTFVSRAVEQARLEETAAKSKYNRINSALNEQKGLVNQFQNASVQYNILQREVDANQELYKGVLDRLKQTSVMAGAEFGNVQIVEPGRPNPEIDSPKMWRNLVLALLVGLTLGMGVVLIGDFWDRSISTLEEAEQAANLPGLGTVPRHTMLAWKEGTAGERWKPPTNGTSLIRSGNLLEGRNHSNGGSKGGSKKSSERSKGADKPTAVPPGFPEAGIEDEMALAAEKDRETALPPMVSESIRYVVASILLSQIDRKLRVIMVTSAVPGEGKTTLVREIGASLAETGARTLLVETDMHKPELSKIAGDFKGDDGLSIYLSGNRSEMPRAKPTRNGNLFVVSAGPRPPNPAALLRSERFGAFLREMSKSFEFVLLDAPPVLAVADARVLSSQVDGVVMVVRAGKTPRSVMARSQAILRASGANVIGVLLNQADPKDMESSKYPYYLSAN